MMIYSRKMYVATLIELKYLSKIDLLHDLIFVKRVLQKKCNQKPNSASVILLNGKSINITFITRSDRNNVE